MKTEFQTMIEMLAMKNVIPVAMAGALGTHGLIAAATLNWVQEARYANQFPRFAHKFPILAPHSSLGRSFGLAFDNAKIVTPFV